MLKLDVGAGETVRPGFVPLGRDHGSEIYPLPYPNECVDEIVASHVLEHFSHHHIGEVFKDWCRVLKKGGRLRIAVPNFEKIAKNYLEGKEDHTEKYLLGGQMDVNDFHKAMFDEDRLTRLFAANDMVLVRPWKSDIDDCAAYDISLNLEGYKPHLSSLKVSGAMSVPRLCFTDNMFCAIEAVLACSVKFRKHGGAYWGQSLTNVFERILEEDETDCILTVDYDSIFTPKHLAKMMQIMMLHPEIDALAPIQSSRHLNTSLFTIKGDGPDNKPLVKRTDLDPDTIPVNTAHFGLTLIRTEKLRKLPKPWFHSVPSASGQWHEGDGHIDEDIQFWRKWEAEGFSLHLANRVAIGHAELQVRWPDINLETMHQSMSDFQKKGVPEGVWQ